MLLKTTSLTAHPDNRRERRVMLCGLLLALLALGNTPLAAQTPPGEAAPAEKPPAEEAAPAEKPQPDEKPPASETPAAKPVNSEGDSPAPEKKPAEKSPAEKAPEKQPAEKSPAPEKKSAEKAPDKQPAEKSPEKKPAEKPPAEKAPDKQPAEKSPTEKAPEKPPAEKSLAEGDSAKPAGQESAEKAPGKSESEKTSEKEAAGETAGETKESAGETKEAAGETKQAEADETTKTRLVYYGRRENSRLRWHFGFGRGELKPGVVSAASPSWFLNSAVRSAGDPTYQPAIPVEPGGIAKYWSFQTGLQWAYKDRFFFSFNWYWIDQPLGNNNSTTVSFLHPPQSRFRYSYFEGLRLANYKEDHKDFEFKYLAPFRWRGFKAGFHIAREFYKETNDISYGSFQATDANSPIEPNSRAWSIGGVVPKEYEMKGWALGPSFRYKIFNWFTMYYQMSLLWERTGSFKQAGLQTLSVQDDITGATRVEALAPIAGGLAKDSGLRHRLEAEFGIFCRYTVTVGILKEDFEREYEAYGGYTFGTIPYFYSQQTALGLGIGETSQAHEVSKQEIYVKFGVDFFFGGAESERRVYNASRGGGSGCPVG